MTNPVAARLEAAIPTAPYVIEKERYKEAAQEIHRLQALVDQLLAPESTRSQDLITYPGTLWHADESDDCVRIFRGDLQIIKAPKQGTPYEEYWPDPVMTQWIVDVLNQAELRPTLDT